MSYDDYFGESFWADSYWADTYWAEYGTPAPPTPALANKWIGQAVLKRKRTRRQRQAIRNFLEAELCE